MFVLNVCVLFCMDWTANTVLCCCWSVFCIGWIVVGNILHLFVYFCIVLTGFVIVKLEVLFAENASQYLSLCWQPTHFVVAPTAAFIHSTKHILGKLQMNVYGMQVELPTWLQGQGLFRKHRVGLRVAACD